MREGFPVAAAKPMADVSGGAAPPRDMLTGLRRGRAFRCYGFRVFFKGGQAVKFLAAVATGTVLPGSTVSAAVVNLDYTLFTQLADYNGYGPPLLPEEVGDYSINVLRQVRPGC